MQEAHERRHVPVGPNPGNFSSGIDHRGRVPGWGHEHPPCPQGSTRFPGHLRVVDLALRLRSAAVHRHPNPRPMRSVPPDRVVPPVSLCAPPVSPRKPKTSLKYPSFNASAFQLFRAETLSLSPFISNLLKPSQSASKKILILYHYYYFIISYYIFVIYIIYYIFLILYYICVFVTSIVPTHHIKTLLKSFFLFKMQSSEADLERI